MKMHNTMKNSKISLYACQPVNVHARFEKNELSTDVAAKAAARRIIAKVKKARQVAIQTDQ